LTSPAAERAHRFRTAITDSRKNAKASAQALGVLGSTGLTVLAIEKFADVFPLRGWWSVLAAALAVLGFFLVAAAIARFTARLWKVDRPVFLSESVEDVNRELMADGGELKAARVKERYDEMAHLNGARSLASYAARGRRFERIAASLAEDDPRRARLRTAAQEIRDDVDATKALVGADVVRGRARDVVWSKETAGLAAAFTAGLAMVAVNADYLAGERAGRLTIAKGCAAAGKALQDQTVANRGVPPICDEPAEAGAAPEAGERELATANACAAAVEALVDQGLKTDALTSGSAPPCPKANATPADKPAAPRRKAVLQGLLPELLARAQSCEEAKGRGNCQPIYDLIDQERDRPG
jgi:hypothetical protein